MVISSFIHMNGLSLCNNNVVGQALVFLSDSLLKGCDILLSASTFLCTKVTSMKFGLDCSQRPLLTPHYQHNISILRL
jgi:hypothetical protein